MKKMFLLLSLFFLFGANSPKASYVVEKIEDGDTIVVNIDGKSQRVQLSGIDAPENTENAKFNLDHKVKKIAKSQLFEIGKLATEHLEKLVAAGQLVSFQGESNLRLKDTYGRIPANVINEKGESLNINMVENGYAVVLTRFPLNDDFKSDLQKAQKKALSEKKGLWSSHPVLVRKWSKINIKP